MRALQTLVSIGVLILCAPAVAAAALIARSLGHPPMPRDLTQAQVQHEVNR